MMDVDGTAAWSIHGVQPRGIANRLIVFGAGAVAGFSPPARPTMGIRPRSRSLSKASSVQITLLWRPVPACGLLAARDGMADVTSARQRPMHSWRIIVA